MTSLPRNPARVVSLRPSAVEVRRARQQVRLLIGEAVEDLLATEDDLGAIHGAFLATAAAVRIVVRHGLDLDHQGVAS